MFITFLSSFVNIVNTCLYYKELDVHEKNLTIFSFIAGSGHLPPSLNVLNVKNGNTRTDCDICSKLTIKVHQYDISDWWLILYLAVHIYIVQDILSLKSSFSYSNLMFCSGLSKRFITELYYWNHTLTWCFPVNLMHIFRTPFPKKTSGWMFLFILFNSSSRPEVFCKNKVFLKISQNSREKTYGKASFLIKFHASDLQFYLQRDFGTGVLLWIL